MTSTVKTRIVEQFIEGIRTADHRRILACLTEDVTWQMPPLFELSGRSAFGDSIERIVTPAPPDIVLTRLVEDDDVVVAEGAVRAAPESAGRLDARFCDVFEFRGDKICSLVTYQVKER